MTKGHGPGIKVGESTIVSSPIGLDKLIDVEPIDVVKEGSIL